MPAMDNDKDVQKFLNTVCQYVRAKELHSEIREEISGHIAERVESLQTEGYSEEAAFQEAVRLMGSPMDIGKSLHQAHRPIPNWRMMVIIAFMAVIGLFAALNVQSSGSVPYISGFFEKKTLLTGIGLLALAGFYFFDYRKLQKYADGIFFMTLGLMVVTLLSSNTVNGSAAYFIIGHLGINVMELSLLLLLMSLAGMKSERQLGWLEIGIQFIYRGVVPIFMFYSADSFTPCLIYVIGYLLITWHANKNVKYFLLYGLPILVMFSVLLLQVDQVRHRVAVFFNPTQGEDYQLIQTVEAIRSAGWTGHGFAASNKTLPFLHSESLFPYLIYCFGWGAAIIIGVLVLLFLIEIWLMITSLHDPFAKRVIIAFTTVIAFHMLWPILMAFGIVPFANIELPFIAGGLHQILYFAAIGIVLSMYRRKNMLPSLQVT